MIKLMQQNKVIMAIFATDFWWNWTPPSGLQKMIPEIQDSFLASDARNPEPFLYHFLCISIFQTYLVAHPVNLHGLYSSPHSTIHYIRSPTGMKHQGGLARPRSILMSRCVLSCFMAFGINDKPTITGHLMLQNQILFSKIDQICQRMI